MRGQLGRRRRKRTAVAVGMIDRRGVVAGGSGAVERAEEERSLDGLRPNLGGALVPAIRGEKV